MRVLRVPTGALAKVVAFTLFSAVLTAGLGVKIGNLRLFSHTYTLKAVFDDASGVFKGDAVKLAGVDVGRVKGTQIDKGLAVVEFNVDESVKLTNTSTVAIRWRNVLGQRFLYVFPGDRAAGRTLKDGDVIPVSRTDDAGDISAFLNKIGPILQAIDPDKANAFVDSLNTALAGNEGTVRALIGDAAQLAGRLGDMDQQIKEVISSSDTVLTTYANQDQSIQAILDDLNSVGGRLSGMTSDINAFVTDFAAVQKQLDKLLKDNKSNIDFDLQALNDVAAVLSQNKANLASTLCSLPPGLAGYFQTTSWGEWFNVRIVKIAVKDSSGNIISTANELPGSRQPQDPEPVFGCKGSPNNPGAGAGKNAPASKATRTSNPQPGAGTGSSSGTGSGSGSGSGNGASSSKDGFGDVGSFLDFVLGGRSRA
jgi:phospholipid/cholesterol/gamma-HCH transport system substrate-binding protein